MNKVYEETLYNRRSQMNKDNTNTAFTTPTKWTCWRDGALHDGTPIPESLHISGQIWTSSWIPQQTIVRAPRKTTHRTWTGSIIGDRLSRVRAVPRRARQRAGLRTDQGAGSGFVVGCERSMKQQRIIIYKDSQSVRVLENM